MAKTKIFPDSVIEQSYQQIIAEHSKRTNIIYMTIICTLILIFISLFFIKIDVGINVIGSVKPVNDPVKMVSSSDGILSIHNLTENCDIQKGDTVFTIRNKKTGEVEIITAPSSGICIGLEKLSDGLKVETGQILLSILPDDELCIECNLTSKDISYICEGLTCNIQIDAYNYNQWGTLRGNITYVSKNPTITYQGNFYKVRCDFTPKYLELKNGHKGYIKYGMNASCRFIVARRSVFELLYDKIEDWINPLNNKKTADISKKGR